MRLKTVTVDRDGVAVVINYTDYVPGVDKLWEESPKASTEQSEDDEKDALIAALKERGIERDRRTGINRLRELLENAE